jgi:hypothetical protein
VTSVRVLLSCHPYLRVNCSIETHCSRRRSAPTWLNQSRNSISADALGAFPAFLLSLYVLITLKVEFIAQGHRYDVFEKIECQSLPTYLYPISISLLRVAHFCHTSSSLPSSRPIPLHIHAHFDPLNGAHAPLPLALAPAFVDFPRHLALPQRPLRRELCRAADFPSSIIDQTYARALFRLAAEFYSSMRACRRRSARCPLRTSLFGSPRSWRSREAAFFAFARFPTSSSPPRCACHGTSTSRATPPHTRVGAAARPVYVCEAAAAATSPN